MKKRKFLYDKGETPFPHDLILQQSITQYLSDPNCPWRNEAMEIKNFILSVPLLKWNFIACILQTNKIELEKTKKFCRYLLRPNIPPSPEDFHLKKTIEMLLNYPITFILDVYEQYMKNCSVSDLMAKIKHFQMNSVHQRVRVVDSPFQMVVLNLFYFLICSNTVSQCSQFDLQEIAKTFFLTFDNIILISLFDSSKNQV